MAILFFDRIEMGEVGVDFNQIPEALLELLGVELFITNDSLSPEVYKSLLTVVTGLNTDKSLRLANINQSGVAHASYGPLIRIKSPASASSIQRYGFTASISGNPTNQPGNWERGIITDQIDIASLRQMSGSISLVSDFNKCVYLEDTQTGNKVTLPPDSISDSIPFFVEIEIDRTVATDNVRLYIDNHLEGTLTVTLSPDFYELYIGSNGTHKTYDSTKDKLFYTFFDNIYVSDNNGTKHTERLGSVKAIRVPISNSIQTDFIPTNAPDNISAINKNVGEILSYNQTNNELPNSSDFFSLNLDNLSDDLEIYAVQQLAAYRTNDNYTKQLSLEIKTGLKSDYTILPKQLTTFDSSPIKVLESYLDGNGWDLTKLNSTHFGYSALTDIPPVGPTYAGDFEVSGVYVFAAYDVKPAPTVFEPLVLKIDTTTFDPTLSNSRNQVTIGFSDYGEYNMNDLRIDFGDGYIKEFDEQYIQYRATSPTDEPTNSGGVYRYWTSGIYELKIYVRENFSYGRLPLLRIECNSSTSSTVPYDKPVTAVLEWGTGIRGVSLRYMDTLTSVPDTLSYNITDMSSMFSACRWMNIPQISNWDTSNVTNMQYVFDGARSFNQPLNWDTSNVTSMRSMFYNAISFNQPLTFDTSKVTNMSSMFENASSFNQPLTFTNTSKVSDMQYMFDGAKAFNQPLDFDTSNVTSMRSMFYNANSFDQPLTFDTSKVTNMSSMFGGTWAFNQPLDFDTSKVTDMASMFYSATLFDQPLTFDTSNVTDMYGMFQGARAFNQPLNFNTSNVTNMQYMFSGATSFDQPLNFNTSNVTNMQSMFGGTDQFNQPLDFDTSKVTNMNNMFYNAISFNQPLTFDTSNVTNMSYMFQGAHAFNQPVTFDTSNVTNMSYMFNNAISFNQPLTFDTSNVTNMSYMFNGAISFNQPLDFDTSNVTNMSYMFYNAPQFNRALNFNTSKVSDMQYMFYGATVFNQSLDFDTSNVTNMRYMFRNALAFNQPVTFDTSNVTNMSYMFYGATAFNQPLDFDTSNVTNMGYMFNGATSFNQNISDWCVTKLTTKPYAFDTNTTNWYKLDRQPRWGTCTDDKILRIIYNGSSSQIVANAATSVDVTIPTISQVNNTIILATTMSRSVITPPDGWTLIQEVVADSPDLTYTQTTAIYKKDLTESDDSNKITTWTQATSNRFIVQLHVFTSDDINKRIDVVESLADKAPNPPIATPIMTSNSIGQVVLSTASFIFAATSGSTTLTGPASMVRVSPASIANNRLIAAYQVLDTGASTSGTFTSSNADGSECGVVSVRLSMVDL